MKEVELTTLEQYKKMTPFQQGYTVYAEAAIEGSELKDVDCEYEKDSVNYKAWHRGQNTAMQHAQDGDDE